MKLLENIEHFRLVVNKIQTLPYKSDGNLFHVEKLFVCYNL